MPSLLYPSSNSPISETLIPAPTTSPTLGISKSHDSVWIISPKPALHIERLKLLRERVQEHRLPNDVRHLPLRGLGNVVADPVRDHDGLAILALDDVARRVLFGPLDAVFVEPVDRLDVREAREGARRGGEVGVQGADEG
ncbi:hypothetical protein AX14_005869 [Amanita brunnescens Koide BX004]|nr:hypothetical protein AX14_005869 [Amanita brunnescens Koide BX004]